MGIINQLAVKAITERKDPEYLIHEALNDATTLTEAAELLGMSRQGLHYQLNRRGIANPFQRPRHQHKASK